MTSRLHVDLRHHQRDFGDERQRGSPHAQKFQLVIDITSCVLFAEQFLLRHAAYFCRSVGRVPFMLIGFRRRANQHEGEWK